MSSTVWKLLPKAINKKTKEMKGTSVPKTMAFIGPISLMPVTKAVKDKAVPMMMIKATASQPVRSKTGQSGQTCQDTLRNSPPIIMPNPLATAAPQFAASP